ncbi:hypothetical protein EKK58_06660 [Candidatus Dependentiae bacterium]|nr:MAG: hypothetical protein EKK58_06660 [Candidatus Dependentiae bacterium]
MVNIIVKAFYCQLFIATYIFSQGAFFNELEQQLRQEEQDAISAILYEAKEFPHTECLPLLYNIEEARNTIKKTLFGNGDQQYFWTPREDTVTPTVIQDHNDFTMEKIALYTAQYANMLGIKPGVIKAVYKPSETNNYRCAFVKATDLKENNFKMHFCIDWMNQQHRVFPHSSHTILHELTHIIEGHPLVTDLIISAIEPYYSNNGLPTGLDQKIKALMLIHEKIADIVPLMWSNKVSSIQKIQQYAFNFCVLSCTPVDDVHLTVAERCVYNSLIYTEHQNTSIQGLLFIVNQMPNLKCMLIKRVLYFTSVGFVGVGIGGYIGNKVF